MRRAVVRISGALGGGLIWAIVMVMAASASACSVSCALSFASGPVSWLEVLVVVPVIGVVAFVFVQAFRYTLRPGEQTPDHIKWRILQEDEDRL
ncbi:hypothetical protein C2W62_06405 [Candidatus Entotheonella serta]|nr:hypothetical protein C2W62_06405 [Candidatus Entotheonella serta]